MIPVAEPSLGFCEWDATQIAIASGWVSGGGEFVDEFERRIAEATGRKWAVATITGTMALHLALDVVRTKPYQVLRMPSLTFCAAANAMTWVWAKPHFCDIGEDWSPDLSSVGPHVVDAAPAISRTLWPVWWKHDWDRKVAVFSFNGNKTITTGQGGAVVGDAKADHERCLHLAGVAKVKGYEVDEVGYNARMSNVLAAIGCAQMERLEEFREKKAAIMRRYGKAGLNLLGSAWMAVWSVANRPAAISTFKEAGIEAKPFWTPLHLQKPYKTCARDPDLTRTEALWDKLICLPCGTSLTEADQNKVIKCAVSLQ